MRAAVRSGSVDVAGVEPGQQPRAWHPPAVATAAHREASVLPPSDQPHSLSASVSAPTQNTSV